MFWSSLGEQSCRELPEMIVVEKCWERVVAKIWGRVLKKCAVEKSRGRV